MKFLYWFFGISFAVGIASTLFTEPNSSTGNSKPSPAAAPNALELMRQRINADKLAAADFAKFQKLDKNAFCTKELPKLRTAKLNPAQTEALMLVAMTHEASAAEQASIKNKTVHVGMSACSALAAWGKPEKVNSHDAANYSQEQWVYGSGNYLYMRKGEITSMQTSR